MIPKIIWQCNLWEEEELPDHLKLNSENCKKLNPNFEYNYVSDSKMNTMMNEYSKKYDNIIKKFWEDENVKKFEKSDLWRAICLYENGGVYFDHDTHFFLSLDEKQFDKNNILLSYSGFDTSVKKQSIANGAFAISKKNMLMLSYIYFFIECIKYYYEYDLYKAKFKYVHNMNWWWKFYPLSAASWSIFWDMSLNYFKKGLPEYLDFYKMKEYFYILDFSSINEIKNVESLTKNNIYPVLHGNLFKSGNYDVIYEDNFVSLGKLNSFGPWNRY